VTDLNSYELLALFREGDTQAATAIVDRYIDRLLTLARARLGTKLQRRIDAEDVVQSAYRSFFVHAQKNEYALSNSGDLWRLLVSITLNKLYGQVERHTAERRSIDREEAANSSIHRRTTGPEPTLAEFVAVAEQLQLINNRLMPEERHVLTAYLQGDSIETIANATQKSQRTIRRLLANVRQLFERHLIDSEDSQQRITQATQHSDPRAPLSHSDYVLERLLNAGGMGKVYRAKQRSTGATVAIKSLLKSRQADPFVVEKFLEEAAIMARLKHPNIVGVRGVGRFPSGGFFIVMDFVKGTDLQSRIAQRPLVVAEAVRIVCVVAHAIAYAHKLGIVHGDIKPANILIDETRRIMITDFGLAQFIDTTLNSMPWLVGGTDGYIAPEVRLHGLPPMPAADIYALGALLSALVTGFAPRGPDPALGLEFSETGVAQIVAKCLAANPNDRYQSAGEFAKVLDCVGM
jgi:DNA-directed RNA polymerase specialized sigma24 family protein/predicted Ser/Thr protein kinase